MTIKEIPTALTVRADETEFIDQLTVTLPAGTQAYWYKFDNIKSWANNDANADGVPDFLDSTYDNSVPTKVNHRLYSSWP